jgi:hypothetical protein
MRYSPFLKVGSIDEPETIKGFATRMRMGTTIRIAIRANLNNSLNVLFSWGLEGEFKEDFFEADSVDIIFHTYLKKTF